MEMKKTIGLLIIIVLLIVLHMVRNKCASSTEHWQSYIQNPLNYVYTGTSPLYFYRKDRYRKPYNYDQQIYQSYPYPHLTYLQ
jgi:hypothetical protein